MFGRGNTSRISLALISVLALSLFATGCASSDRLPPVPLAMASKVNVDIPDARFYPDTEVSVWLRWVSRHTDEP